MDKLFVLIENRPIPFAIMFAIWMGAAVVIRKWYKNRPEREFNELQVPDRTRKFTQAGKRFAD